MEPIGIEFKRVHEHERMEEAYRSSRSERLESAEGTSAKYARPPPTPPPKARDGISYRPHIPY